MALLKLPDDPGGGLPWPQAAQTELEPGERVRICGHGLTEGGATAESLRCVEQTVVWVRPAILRLDDADGHYGRGDSGGGVFRAETGTQVALVSHIGVDGRMGEPRYYAMPFPAVWAAGVRGAWRD